MSYLEKIQQDFKNTPEPMLQDIINYFNSSDKELNVSNIQRVFKMGYNRACRALDQIQQKK